MNSSTFATSLGGTYPSLPRLSEWSVSPFIVKARKYYCFLVLTKYYYPVKGRVSHSMNSIFDFTFCLSNSRFEMYNMCAVNGASFMHSRSGVHKKVGSERKNISFKLDFRITFFYEIKSCYYR